MSMSFTKFDFTQFHYPLNKYEEYLRDANATKKRFMPAIRCSGGYSLYCNKVYRFHFVSSWVFHSWKIIKKKKPSALLGITLLQLNMESNNSRDAMVAEWNNRNNFTVQSKDIIRLQRLTIFAEKNFLDIQQRR